jgi:hypothetical protein
MDEGGLIDLMKSNPYLVKGKSSITVCKGIAKSSPYLLPFDTHHTLIHICMSL